MVGIDFLLTAMQMNKFSAFIFLNKIKYDICSKALNKEKKSQFEKKVSKTQGCVIFAESSCQKSLGDVDGPRETRYN